MRKVLRGLRWDLCWLGVGLFCHGMILFLPRGFNADAATEALKALDFFQGRGSLTFLDFDGYSVWLLPLWPLVLPFKLFGPHVWPVRVLMLGYDLVAVWAIWNVARRWFGRDVARVALGLALFSPWLSEPFSVTVTTAASLPMLGIALSESRRQVSRVFGYLVLGVSFYAYHTARVPAILYLILVLVFRRQEIKERALPFFLCAIAIVPAAILGGLSSTHRKLFAYPQWLTPGEIWERTRTSLSWGTEGLASPLFALLCLVSLVLVARDILKQSEGRLQNFWILGMGGTALLAFITAPFLRQRVLLHASPALFLAIALALMRIPDTWRIFRGIFFFFLLGPAGLVHVLRMTDPRAESSGGADYGPCEAVPHLKELSPEWIAVDYRMDDQMLFLSDRAFPMDDAVFPRTGGGTFPWLGYAPHSGKCAYVFWSDSLEKETFFEWFPGVRPCRVIEFHRGGRALEIYQVDKAWNPDELRRMEQAGIQYILKEGDFWKNAGDAQKASCLYNEILTRFPQADEAPSAGLKAGICLLESGQDREGITILKTVAGAYPWTEEAVVCQQVIQGLASRSRP